MKVKYSNNSTRWEVILFSYADSIPQTTKSKVNVFSGNKGVVSIGISRSKASVQNTANIQVVGDLNPAYTIGNWIIIKSKVGKFDSTKKHKKFNSVSPLAEGVVRFIGQITTIESSYSVAGNGLLTKRATIHIREWSSVLNIPVRLDAYAFSNEFFKTASAQGRLGLMQGALKNNGNEISIEDLAQDVFDPFTSASLVLAIVGGLNTDKISGVDLQDSLGKYKGLINLSTLTSRMPTLPQELLDYLELPSSTRAEQAFSTGFVNTLVGVSKPNNNQKKEALEKYGQEQLDSGSFSGYFTNYDKLKNLFKNYIDRPVSSNFLASLGKGTSAWSLIQQQLDLTTNEAFTDIWYFKTDSGAVTSVPMIVLRDKPFALKSLLENPENKIKATNWTSFDDVPRVFIGDEFIQSLSTNSSFFNSPNYIEPQFQSGEIGSVRGDSPQGLYAKAVHRIIDNPAIDRFGTIEHYWDTIYSSPTAKKGEKNEIVSVDWFDDAKKLMYYWHTLNYRFGNANLTIKDNDLRVMVGCNVSFPMGKNVLCGQVEAISWNFGIDMSGAASTTTNIKLSYLCRVKSDGSLGLIGPQGFTNLMDKDLTSPSVEETITLPQLKTDGIEKAESLVNEFMSKLNLPKLPKVPFR